MFLVGVALTGALGLLAVLLVFSGSIAISAVLPLAVVSGLVSFVTWILATIGFFRIRASTSQTFPQPTSQAVASVAQVKYCPRCGAENFADATYCTHCGQRF
jgi:ribosomal protein L40E